MLGRSYIPITEHGTNGTGYFILMLSTGGEVLSTRKNKEGVEEVREGESG